MGTEEKLTTVAEKVDGPFSALFQATADGLKLFLTIKRIDQQANKDKPPDPTADQKNKPEQDPAADGALAPSTEAQPAAEAASAPAPAEPEKTPPNPAEPYTVERLRALIGTLADQSLIHGEVIEQLAVELTRQVLTGSDKPLERRRIAKGRAAVPGRDGKLLLLVKKFEQQNNRLPPEVVDPRYIHFFDNIEAKTIVGRLYPPHPGTDGVSFDGKPIPFVPGKAIEVKVDPSVSLNQAGTYQELIAQQAGYLTEDKGVWTIKNELVVGGDLDFRFGDVDFVGSVKIRGSVKKDFTIKARGDIEVSGDVNQARIISKQGSIIINGSCIGERTQSLQVSEATSHQAMNDKMKNRGADISAAKSITISRVENAVIEAGADVTIKREIKTCLLRTRTNLLIPEGQIVGGDTFAVCGVEAGTLGTTVGTATSIYAISDIESSSEYVDLDQQLRSHEAAEEMIKLYLGPYLKMPNRVARLNPDYRKKIEDLMRKLKGIESSKAKLTEDLNKLLSSANQSSIFRVNIIKIAYPGVQLIAEDVEYKINADLKGPVTIEYQGKDKAFTTGELKPVSCEMEKRPAVRRVKKPH